MALLVVALAPACSSGTAPPAAPPSTSDGVQSYTDPANTFTFEYEAPFRQPSEGVIFNDRAGDAPVQSVAVSEPPAKGESTETNLFVVNTFALPAPLTATTYATVMKEIRQTVLPALRQGSPGIRVHPARPAKISGLPGLAADAEMPLGSGVTARSRIYFVVNGSTEFQIVTQAQSPDWKHLEPAFAKMVASFRILNPEPVPTPSGASASPSPS